MATALEETKSTLPAVTYDITAERLAELEAECKELDPAKSTKAYEESRIVLRKLVTTRTTMDKRRKELKADSLAWGRLVDSEYKKWETLLLAIEEPVAAKIKAVDEAKENARRAKEEAERKAIEAELEAKRAAERAEQERIAAEQRAENERIAAANKAEADRLAAIAAEQAAAQKKIDDAKAEVEAAKRKQEQEERERQIRIQAEKDAAERIEREQKAAAERKAAQERAEAAERARIEAARPDVAKVNAIAEDLWKIELPKVTNVKAVELVQRIRDTISELADECAGFKA